MAAGGAVTGVRPSVQLSEPLPEQPLEMPVSAPNQEAYGYRIERTEPYKPQHETYPAPSVFDNLRIRNIRFIDDSRDHVISSGEKSKVIFEIMNEGEQTIYNVVPMVTETTGMKRIYISPPVMVEQIAPHNGVKYTAPSAQASG